MPPITENPSETAPAPPPVSLPELLRDRDIHCPNCRYNLRNLTTNCCPECGQELSIHRLLHPPPTFDYAWLIAWTAVASFSYTSVYFWAELLRNPSSLPYVHDASMQRCMWVVYYLAILPAAILLLIFRRRFSRVRPPIRWAIAAALAAPFLYDLCDAVFRRSNY